MAMGDMPPGRPQGPVKKLKKRAPMVPSASLAAFRIIFGVTMAGAMLRVLAKGWATEMYTDPTFHFVYSGFHWVTPWPGIGMQLHFVALTCFAVAIALGWHYRLFTLLFFLGFTYVELLDKSYYLNHYYLISVLSLLLVLIPTHLTYSLDALRGAVRKRDFVPRWFLWAFQAQIGLVYLFAGMAKLNADWLLQGQPLQSWLIGFTELPLVGSVMAQPMTAIGMSWAGALYDLSVPLFLLNRRTRPYALTILIGFHLATAVLFPIGLFPWLMMGSATLFFAADWPNRMIQRVRSMKRLWRGGLVEVPGYRDFAALRCVTERGAAHIGHTRLMTVGVCALLALQVATPMYRRATNEDYRWTERGFQFAWNVMVVDKASFLEYRVVDSETDRSWIVRPEDYLTDWQYQRMARNPEMIQQLAMKIRHDHELQLTDQSSKPDIAVHADAFVAMNGQPAQRIIDPSVDLTRLNPASTEPDDWILSRATYESDF